MGGASSKEQQAKKIDMNQWTSVGQSNGADIVTSNMGNGMGEIRVIPIDPKKQVSKEMEIYSFRKNEPHIVRCFGAESLKAKSTTMCGNQNTVKVLTERIPKRWAELPQLTFPESLYSLSQSLKAYEFLHGKVGVFDITPYMIGVNNQGEVKSWLNENFAYNHPSYEKPFLQTTALTSHYGNDDLVSPNTSESQMVRNIIEIIEQKCENGRFPTNNNFRDRLYKNSRDFDEAINVTDSYIKQINSGNNSSYQFGQKNYSSGETFCVPDHINLEGISSEQKRGFSSKLETGNMQSADRNFSMRQESAQYAQEGTTAHLPPLSSNVPPLSSNVAPLSSNVAPVSTHVNVGPSGYTYTNNRYGSVQEFKQANNLENKVTNSNYIYANKDNEKVVGDVKGAPFISQTAYPTPSYAFDPSTNTCYGQVNIKPTEIYESSPQYNFDPSTNTCYGRVEVKPTEIYESRPQYNFDPSTNTCYGQVNVNPTEIERKEAYSFSGNNTNNNFSTTTFGGKVGTISNNYSSEKVEQQYRTGASNNINTGYTISNEYNIPSTTSQYVSPTNKAINPSNDHLSYFQKYAATENQNKIESGGQYTGYTGTYTTSIPGGTYTYSSDSYSQSKGPFEHAYSYVEKKIETSQVTKQY